MDTTLTGPGVAYLFRLLTGSTLASGAMLLASYLPQILFGSLAGALVDRWDRRRTMIAADVLLAVGLLPLLLADGPDRIWIVYAVMLWEGSVQIFFDPAEKALLPLLVNPRQLISANAPNGQTADVARLVGGALGGVAAAAGGIGTITLLDLSSFALSALLLAQVRATAGTTAVAPRHPPEKPGRRQFSRYAASLHLTWQRLPLRVVLAFTPVTGVGQGIMSTLFAPFVVDNLHGSRSAYGTVVSAQAVGGIAGGLVVALIGSRFHAVRLWGLGAVLLGAAGSGSADTRSSHSGPRWTPAANTTAPTPSTPSPPWPNSDFPPECWPPTAPTPTRPPSTSRPTSADSVDGGHGRGRSGMPGAGRGPAFGEPLVPVQRCRAWQPSARRGCGRRRGRARHRRLEGDCSRMTWNARSDDEAESRAPKPRDPAEKNLLDGISSTIPELTQEQLLGGVLTS
ncbi:MFS transporter [Streptacidiphilus sp. PAMC 29251]